MRCCADQPPLRVVRISRLMLGHLMFSAEVHLICISAQLSGCMCFTSSNVCECFATPPQSSTGLIAASFRVVAHDLHRLLLLCVRRLCMGALLANGSSECAPSCMFTTVLVQLKVCAVCQAAPRLPLACCVDVSCCLGLRRPFCTGPKVPEARRF